MKKSDLVELRFLDHVEDDEKPIEFLLYGRVCRCNKQDVTVQCWCYPDSYTNDHNVKMFTILRSCVLEVRFLSES